MKGRTASACRACWLLGLLSLGAAVAAPAAEPTKAANRQYAAAMSLHNAGRYKEASDKWVKFIDDFHSDPRLDRGFYYLGLDYIKTNHLELAAKSLQAVIDSFPKSGLLEDAYCALGLTQYTMAQSGKAEMYDKAAATFVAMIGRFPQGSHVAEGLFYQAESLGARGKRAEAAWAYSRLVEKYPAHPLAPDAMYGQAMTVADEASLGRGTTQTPAQGYAAAAAALAAIPTRYPQSKKAMPAHLAAGKYYWLAGQYDHAREHLAKVPASDPNYAEAAHWLSRTLLKENKPGEAAALLDQAVARAGQGAHGAQLMFDWAESAYQTPATRPQAVERYAAVAAKHPNDPLAPKALSLAACTAFALGDHAAAIRHGQAVLDRYPASDVLPDAACAMAESQLQSGQPAEAQKSYERLLALRPRHADADLWKLRLALALVLQKKHAEAVAALTPLTSTLSAPEVVAQAQYLIGSSQAELHHWDAAATALTAAAAAPHWPQAEDALLALAGVERQQGKLDEARRHLAAPAGRIPAGPEPRAAALSPGRVRLRGRPASPRRWRPDWRGRRVRQAAAEYQQVADRWPQSPWVPASLDGLAWARLRLGDYAGVQQAAARLLEQYPHDKSAPRARYVRAMACYQLRSFAAAVEDLQAVLGAGPTGANRSDARYLLALCQVARQQPAAAVESLQTLLREDPRYADADKVLYELAWSLKALGKEQEAAEAFARLGRDFARSPLAPESWYQAAEYAYRKGDFGRAARAYQAALEKWPQSPLGEKAAHGLGWSHYRRNEFAEAEAAFARQRAVARRSAGRRGRAGRSGMPRETEETLCGDRAV